MQIRVQQLKKTYRRGETELTVLHSVDAEFVAGKFHFIVGPSGSGKSSLLYLLGAMDEPTSGKIFVDDSDLTNWSESQRNRFRRDDVGFIFQNFNLMSNLTAIDNVLVPFMPAGINPQLKQKAAQLLEQVGLGHRLTHKPNHLSGGEQQRVAIARALLKAPRLILADEPTGELDSQTGQEIISTLRTLCRDQLATVIIVTHDTSLMTEHDYVHTIKDGKIIDRREPTFV